MRLSLRPLLAALACALLVQPGAAQTALPSSPSHARSHAPLQLPTLGDGASITTSEERRLGDRIIRSFYRDPDYLDDAPLQEYVQGIWQPLLAAARARGEISSELGERFAWELLLGRDRSVNAFALPGGYLGVHLGLIGVVGTRDELASVLAHELSHVSQRHIARLLAQQSRQTPLMIGTMILGALAASKSPDAAQALIVGGQALTAQNQLNFSRDMEREADRVGYSLLAPGGFAPQGAAGMFDRLQQANRLNDNGSWPYLRSHPLTTERIADMHARLPVGAVRTQPPPTLEHAMMAARARVLSRPGVDMLRQWAALPHSGGFAAERVAALYAAVLAHLQLRDHGPARTALAALQKALAEPETTSPGKAAALRQAALLAAELELAAGQPAAALQALDQVKEPADRPTRPLLLLRTQVLLRLNQAPGAGEALQEIAGPLQTWVATRPRDAAAWQALAQVWQAQGQGLRALRAEAEAHAAHYDYAAALDRFRAGQDLAQRSHADRSDYIEASIIDTRLRAMEELLREQAAQQ